MNIPNPPDPQPPAATEAQDPSRATLQGPPPGNLPFPLTAVWVVGVLFLLTYGSTFVWMMGRWISDPSAMHGWLVIPLALAVVWSKREKLSQIPLVSDRRGLWVIAFALFLHLTEVFFDINGPSPLSIPIFMTGAVWYFAGTAWVRELSFPLAYLLFMVPIPGAINQFVSAPLRLIATNGSKAVVHYMGIDIAGAGMNMEFWRPGIADHSNPNRDFIRLIVADPCSGLHSLMAIKALHAITAYVSRLDLKWKWVLFWCALPISTLANVCRMIFIILVSAYVNKEFGLHVFHDYSPYLLFFFVFLFLILVGFLMEWGTGAWLKEARRSNRENGGSNTNTTVVEGAV